MGEVCVTGGTGFIAGYLIRSSPERLQSSHYRSQSRYVEKFSYLWDLPGAKEGLNIVRADLLEEGSFDAAVEGVAGVFHTASPVLVPYNECLKETLLDSSVKGTINVLKSCSRSTSVKRVVITASCSAIRYDYNNPERSPLDESHWSNLDYCKQYNLWYAYAKTMAEKEAWKFAEEQGLNLVVVNPIIRCGPLLAPEPTSTLSLLLSLMKGAISNRRFICSADVAHFKEIVDMLKKKYPMYPIADKCGGEIGNDMPHTMNTSKIKSLGLASFKNLEQMFEDCIKSFEERGLLQNLPDFSFTTPYLLNTNTGK